MLYTLSYPDLTLLPIVSVLRELQRPCPLENNTLLHIDLSSLSSDPDGLYSYRGSSGGTAADVVADSPQLWVLLAGVLGGVCFMMMLFAATFIACRYAHAQKRHRHRAEVERITAELKDAMPVATDV